MKEELNFMQKIVKADKEKHHEDNMVCAKSFRQGYEKGYEEAWDKATKSGTRIIERLFAEYKNQ